MFNTYVFCVARYDREHLVDAEKCKCLLSLLQKSLFWVIAEGSFLLQGDMFCTVFDFFTVHLVILTISPHSAYKPARAVIPFILTTLST